MRDQRQSDFHDPRAFPFHDRDQILALADEYWSLISTSEAQDERAFEAELPALRMKRSLPRSMFLRIARWKSNRNNRHYEANSDADVLRAVDQAFTCKSDAKGAIRALDELRGVALRTATALLHWIMPTEYIVLDFRIVEALGLDQPKGWESVKFYERIARNVMDRAHRLSVDLRTLDRALWAWSKKRAKSTSSRRCRIDRASI